MDSYTHHNSLHSRRLHSQPLGTNKSTSIKRPFENKTTSQYNHFNKNGHGHTAVLQPRNSNIQNTKSSGFGEGSTSKSSKNPLKMLMNRGKSQPMRRKFVENSSSETTTTMSTTSTTTSTTSTITNSQSTRFDIYQDDIENCIASPAKAPKYQIFQDEETTSSPTSLDMSTSEEVTSRSRSVESSTGATETYTETVSSSYSEITEQLSDLIFIEDIYYFNLEKELSTRPENYIKRQKEIGTDMRTILIDWLIEVTVSYWGILG